jgi:DNA primase
MDVIALAQAGFRAAVAPLGTALTETQIEELWKVMPEDKRAPILCFDGDAAGQRAAGRALERIFPILKPDHTAKFAFLPEEHDPDSLVKKEGVPAMERVLKNAISLFEMMWQEEAKDRDMTQPETRAGFRSALEKRARAIADGSVQKFFIHEINQRVNEVFLNTASEKKSSQPRVFMRGKPVPPGVHTPYRPQSMKPSPVKAEKGRESYRARILLALMIHYPELFEEYGEELGMAVMPSMEYDQIREALINLLSEQNSLDYQAVKQHLTQQGLGHDLR